MNLLAIALLQSLSFGGVAPLRAPAIALPPRATVEAVVVAPALDVQSQLVTTASVASAADEYPSTWPRAFEGRATGKYFGARYYSAAQGRFTTPDEPFVGQYEDDPQSWNLYSYTGNNPLNRIDPDGRDWFYRDGSVPVWLDCGTYNCEEGIPGHTRWMPSETGNTLRVDYFGGAFTLGVGANGQPTSSYSADIGLQDLTWGTVGPMQNALRGLAAGGLKAAARAVVLGMTGSDGKGARAGRGERLSRSEARAIARRKGYKEVKQPPFNPHGQPVFKRGDTYISPDTDGHRTGNGWKVFDKYGNRIGTFTEDLSERVSK